MTEVENADLTRLEDGELDFDEESFLDTVTVSKLAFLVPLIEKICTTSNYDVKLKLTALSFLKRSITESFIKVFNFFSSNLI